MGIVLGLDDRDGNVRLVVEDVVGALGLSARDQLATHDDAALGEAHLLADLQHLVPPRPAQGRRDELGADVPFGQVSLVNSGQQALVPSWSPASYPKDSNDLPKAANRTCEPIVSAWTRGPSFVGAAALGKIDK